MKVTNVLDRLLFNGCFKSYSIQTLKEDPTSNMREYERLIIEFNNNNKLDLSTFCSGSLENSCFVVSE